MQKTKTKNVLNGVIKGIKGNIAFNTDGGIVIPKSSANVPINLNKALNNHKLQMGTKQGINKNTLLNGINAIFNQNGHCNSNQLLEYAINTGKMPNVTTIIQLHQNTYNLNKKGLITRFKEGTQATQWFKLTTKGVNVVNNKGV